MYPSVLDNIYISFFDFAEEDLTIRCLGYNNFVYIKPIRHFRTQSFYTLHIILKGSGTLFVGDRKYNPKEGDMFFIPPNTRLCYYPDDDNLWEYVWFEFQGKNAPLYPQKMGFDSQKHLTKCRDFSNITLLLQRLLNHYQKHASVGYYDVFSVFFRILDSNLCVRENQTPNVIDAIINYMQCHYHNPGLSIPELCRYFGISHSYLCKLFQDTHHCSAKKYLIQIRIYHACKLLETTSIGLKEVAYSVGFQDEIHFMKTFKKMMNQTPTQYRQSHSAE